MSFFTDYRELGGIAAAASWVSGKTVTNPYKEGTGAHILFDKGYWAEIKKIEAEEAEKSADS